MIAKRQPELPKFVLREAVRIRLSRKSTVTLRGAVRQASKQSKVAFSFPFLICFQIEIWRFEIKKKVGLL